jgi:hypothetical protein
MMDWRLKAGSQNPSWWRLVHPSLHVLSVQDYRDLKLLTSWQDQLYAAVCFSVINSVEKVSTTGSMCG